MAVVGGRGGRCAVLLQQIERGDPVAIEPIRAQIAVGPEPGEVVDLVAGGDADAQAVGDDLSLQCLRRRHLGEDRLTVDFCPLAAVARRDTRLPPDVEAVLPLWVVGPTVQIGVPAQEDRGVCAALHVLDCEVVVAAGGYVDRPLKGGDVFGRGESGGRSGVHAHRADDAPVDTHPIGVDAGGAELFIPVAFAKHLGHAGVLVGDGLHHERVGAFLNVLMHLGYGGQRHRDTHTVGVEGAGKDAAQIRPIVTEQGHGRGVVVDGIDLSHDAHVGPSCGEGGGWRGLAQHFHGGAVGADGQLPAQEDAPGAVHGIAQPRRATVQPRCAGDG